jgi:hypothetical protein
MQPVLSAADLAQRPVTINALAAGPDGSLYLGTDDGIIIWKEGAIGGKLGRYEGIGTSSIVDWLFADAKERVWFATQGSVGYYTAGDSTQPAITIQIVNRTPAGGTTTPATGVATPVASGTLPAATGTAATATPEPSLLDRLVAFISEILGKFGIPAGETPGAPGG